MQVINSGGGKLDGKDPMEENSTGWRSSTLQDTTLFNLFNFIIIFLAI